MFVQFTGGGVINFHFNIIIIPDKVLDFGHCDFKIFSSYFLTMQSHQVWVSLYNHLCVCEGAGESGAL